MRLLAKAKVNPKLLRGMQCRVLSGGSESVLQEQKGCPAMNIFFDIFGSLLPNAIHGSQDNIPVLNRCGCARDSYVDQPLRSNA